MVAVDAYTQSLDLDPENATVFSNRSICWLRAGQPEHALADARAARKLAPYWPKVSAFTPSPGRLFPRQDLIHWQ